MDAATVSSRLWREEPRAMTDGLIPSCDHTSGCITCGDEAVRMRVLRIDRERGLALCAAEVGGEHSTVEIALVQPVAEDDVLLVHAGTAIAREESGVAA
jgi:hydrogenase maturation factor